MPLLHLIYFSVATQDFSDLQLEDLLAQSRTNNQKTGLTGMLLYAEGSFFQVLEGEALDVDTLYARLKTDSRHGQLTTIVREPIARRTFAEWSMGFTKTTPGELATIPGMNDFFQNGSCFRDLDRGRAQKLLAAFAKGRWRAKLIGSEQAG